MNDKLALMIGRHVLEQYNQWTENPMGQSVIIPVEIWIDEKSKPWCMDVTCNMPWFMEPYFEDGQVKYRHWSMKEWFKKHGEV